MEHCQLCGNGGVWMKSELNKTGRWFEDLHRLETDATSHDLRCPRFSLL
jgi:hypothetical protein